MADGTPRQTNFAPQKDINREKEAKIPAYNSNQRTVNRIRQQNCSQMNEPSSLQGFEFSELLQMAPSGEKFMYQYSGLQDDKGFIVFVTLPAIDLRQSDDWFCDGTFLTAPNVFYQVYTIHASVDGVYFLLVYILRPDKKNKGAVRKLFFSLQETSLKLNLTDLVSLDFYLKMNIYPEKRL